LSEALELRKEATMTQSRWTLALLAAGFLGCGAPPTAPDNPERALGLASEAGFPDVVFSDNAHVMPMRDERAASVVPEATSAHLTYYGGPVISNVQVVTVFWGQKVASTAHLNSFYTAIPNSIYYDWLTEYNTRSQTIGRGTLAGSVTLTSPPGSKHVTDRDIQKELSKLIDQGQVNNANRMFAVHFAPGYRITSSDGSQSCVTWCAYHSTFQKAGKDVFYSVVPDQGASGGCLGGCGSWPSVDDNTTEVSSHELVEATTDPAVGLATSLGAPLGWYDSTNGEIGDICNGRGAKINGFAVQLEWSNKARACIAHR
jgi:hypothetical protein